MINAYQLKQELLLTDRYIENNYLLRYIKLIFNDQKLLEDEYTNNHHIIPYHILKDKNVYVYDDKYIKKLKVSDHILAHFYLFKCSKTIAEKNANINAINLLLNKNIDEKYFNEISDEEISMLAKARDCLKENIKYVNSSKSKGKIFINNGIVRKKIYPEDLDIWVKKGWKKGSLKFTEEHKQKLRKKKPMSEEAKKRLKGRGKGKINIIKDNIVKRIDKNLLEQYIQEGWRKGSKSKSAEQRKHISDLNKGKHISESQKQKLREKYTGYKYMHKDEKEAHVYPHLVSTYLENGWEFGRSDKNKEKIRNTTLKQRGKNKVC